MNTESPEAILRIAAKDPIVGVCISHWKAGEITWEQALQACVVHLYRAMDAYRVAYQGADKPLEVAFAAEKKGAAVREQGRLRGLWNASKTRIYPVVDEADANVVRAYIRHCDGREWLYVDDMDGYKLLDVADVDKLKYVDKRKTPSGKEIVPDA